MQTLCQGCEVQSSVPPSQGNVKPTSDRRPDSCNVSVADNSTIGCAMPGANALGAQRPGADSTRSTQKRLPIRRGLTAYLFFPIFGSAVVLFFCKTLGLMPWWTYYGIFMPMLWYCYVASHDAVHGSAHNNRLLNEMVGWVSTATFGLPFSIMRRAHLSHHVREGRPDDIEQFAYRPGCQLPFGLLFGNWLFYLILPKCNRADRAIAGTMITSTILLLLLCPRTLFLGWLVPMQLVVCFGMVTNIYLPHGRFARWFSQRTAFVTGFHDDHHAMPGYPWHQLCQRKIRNHRRATPARAFCD